MGTGSTDETVDATELDSVVRGAAALPSVDARSVAMASLLSKGAKIDHYEVLGTLGAGAMGIVLRAHDPELGRDVALKIHRPSGGPELAERLLREARALARLSHPHVVTVHAAGRIEGGVYIALELVEGVTAARWRDAGTRTWRQILDVYLQAAAGLAAAHASGIVHRDFKPDNVLVGDDGRVRVADFGLAVGGTEDDVPTRTEDDAGASATGRRPVDTLTRTDAFVGTPRYAAPEQWSALTLDERTDQFAFCVSLFEALEGRGPFWGDTVEVLCANVLEGKYVPPRRGSMPGWLERALRKGLSVAPRQRFADMGELMRAIDPGRRTARSRRAVLGGAGLGLTGWALAATVHHQAPPDPCAAVVDEIAATWNPEVAHRVHDALVSADPTRAEATWSRVEPRVTELVDEWKTTRAEVCATQRSDAAMAGVYPMHTRCMARKLRELEAVLTALQSLKSLEGHGLADAVPSVARLQPSTECRDPARLERQASPPAPELRERVEQLEGELLDLRAGRLAGTRGDLEGLLRLTERAEAIGYAPLHADVLRELADVQESEGDPTTAAASIRRAFDLALAASDDERATRSAIDLADIHGRALRDEAQGRAWLQTARGMLEAGPEVVVARVELLSSEAVLESYAGRPDQAADAFERALALQEEHNPRGIARIGLSASLGVALAEAGHTERARVQLEESLAASRDLLGPTHPNTVVAMSNLGALALRQGRVADALEHLEEAMVLSDGVLATDSLSRLELVSRLGLALIRSGAQERGLELATEAYRRAKDSLGPHHPSTGQFAHPVITQLTKLGETEQAKRIGLELLEGAPPSPRAGNLYLLLGIAEARAREYEAAFEHLRYAAELDPDDRHAALELAKAMLESGRHEEGLQLYAQQFTRADPKDNTHHLHEHRWLYAKALAQDPAKVDTAKAIAAGVLAYVREASNQRPVEDLESDIEAWLAAH